MDKKNHYKSFFIALFILLTGCVVKPTPTTFAEHQQRIESDWQQMYDNQESINKPIDMYEAIARALKYNLDRRLKIFEEALSAERLNVSHYDMLPKLASNAGYTTRENYSAAGSLNLATLALNFAPSASEDITKQTADLQISWNVLDFGVSYFTAKQNADQTLIQLQRRRKMEHNIIRDLRYAYWRAASAQSLEHALKPLMYEVQEALRSSKIIQSDSIMPTLQILEYRKSLYQVLQRLSSLQRNIVQAKSELASLMNLPPGSRFRVVEIEKDFKILPDDFPWELSTLERIALYDRPELREEVYRERVSLNEVKKARLRMLPTLTLTAGKNYDSNSFTLYNTWSNAGLQMGWDLMKILSGPASIKVAKMNLAVDTVRRLALSMAVITQVDVAYYRYKQAEKEMRIAKNLHKVGEQIYTQTKNLYIAGRLDRLRLIHTKANRLLDILRYNLDYAEWQNTTGQLLTSIGYDPVGDLDTSQNLVQLTEQVRERLGQVPTRASEFVKRVRETIDEEQEVEYEEDQLLEIARASEGLEQIVQEVSLQETENV